jgi:hypothetical protein
MLDRIRVDPGVGEGRPTIRGLRITVELVLPDRMRYLLSSVADRRRHEAISADGRGRVVP